jgi:hypothetical protein
MILTNVCLNVNDVIKSNLLISGLINKILEILLTFFFKNLKSQKVMRCTFFGVSEIGDNVIFVLNLLRGHVVMGVRINISLSIYIYSIVFSSLMTLLIQLMKQYV